MQYPDEGSDAANERPCNRLRDRLILIIDVDTDVPWFSPHNILSATMSDSASINDVEEGKRQTTSPIKSFLSGAAGGVSCVLVGHPFDLTKTRLQTAVKGQYTGAMDVVKQTLARDGVRG